MDPLVFGAFIQQRRKELNMNQAHLAEKLNVTANAVSRWERGVGFPDIKLLQPLADALEITIVELMQSKKIEADLPKEEAAELVSDTVTNLQIQERLSWKRKIILAFGTIGIAAASFFLIWVSNMFRGDSRWIGFVIYMISYFTFSYGIRWFHAIVTKSYLQPDRPHVKLSSKEKIAAAVFLLAIPGLLLSVSSRRLNSSLRDFLSVLNLMLLFFSGLYLNNNRDS